MDPLNKKLYFFDAEDISLPPKPGKVMCLSIDYQIIVKWDVTRPLYIPLATVNAFLSDLDYDLLVGKSETFNTLPCAMH